MRNVRDFRVKRITRGGTRSCMRQQTRYAGVCTDWEQKFLRVLKYAQSAPLSTTSLSASEQLSTVYSVCDWPDSYRQSTLFGIGLKSAPR